MHSGLLAVNRCHLPTVNMLVSGAQRTTLRYKSLFI
ncbi:hypothetical protein AB205_0102360 [Aquarana catesbeiana]|uniref:Uncharacterized protein n=1 Tax=Aquarana catesbeiana TaxID=8400 RepID=A0A2G9RAC8_AQUCT|nr:hypothetical protein AB205_0102360 [Aquarana catesbeiana]